MCDHVHVASTCHRTAASRVFLHTFDDHIVAPCRRTCFTHVTAASRHARHGVHTCVLVWHDTLGDTRCTTGEQTAVLCAFAWAPFVAASRASPRTSWAAKLGSLAFSSRRIVFLHTIRTLGHFLTSELSPFSDLKTWAVFGRARTTFRGHACPELSKVRVTLETLIDNVTLLFLSHYDSTSHMQFLVHHARTHGPPRHGTHTCFGIGRASAS